MAMPAAKLFLVLFILPVFGDKPCTSKQCAIDDVTSLLQKHVELKPGGAKPTKISALEETVWLGKNGMLTKGIAEFLAMTLFVFIGCGTAMSLPESGGKLFHLSLTFGFAITALAYAIGHYSGGQINFAVTFALMCIKSVTITQGFVNLVFQLLGSICGSLLTYVVFSPESDQTRDKVTGAGGLGTNAVDRRFTKQQAIVGEIMGTFILVYVVMETAVNPETVANRSLACLAIGISVFLAHSVLIPVDGCSINPTRSFGPMVVKKMFRPNKDIMSPDSNDDYFDHHWVFWLGPLSGALFAAITYHFMHED